MKELAYIRKNDVKAGIAINPDTDENRLLPLLDYLDYILIMSVFPGYGGQALIHNTLTKMENIVKMKKGRNIDIGVHGGINVDTISQVYDTGIDIVIVGSGLFGANNLKKRYNDLLNA